MAVMRLYGQSRAPPPNLERAPSTPRLRAQFNAGVRGRDGTSVDLPAGFIFCLSAEAAPDLRSTSRPAARPRSSGLWRSTLSHRPPVTRLYHPFFFNQSSGAVWHWGGTGGEDGGGGDGGESIEGVV